MAAGVLTIGGVAYDQSARKANSLIVDEVCMWDLDGNSSLDFHEYAATYQPKFPGPRTASYTDAGGTLRFTGDIVAVQPGWSDEGRTWGYRCLGLKYRANQLPVVGIDGANTKAFNLRLQDEDYIAANAGRSLGQILTTVFADHAAALAAVGVSTDSTTAGQLATFTLVPPDPVYVQGERLMDAIEWVLRQYAPYARLMLTPSGKVRFVDTAAGDSHTLTMGVDPVEPPLFSRDWTSCASRVVVRGKGRIYPVIVSTRVGDLQPAWTAPQQAAWSMSDFDKPGDAYDWGAVTTTGGPTSITVRSHDASVTWPVNFWSDRRAWIDLKKTTGIGLQYQEPRPITACTALTAGGTSVLTLGLDLDNSASTAWDTYQITGAAGDLAHGRNNVYRLFNIVTPGHWIEQHLVKQFPTEVPNAGLNNASVGLVTVPTGTVEYDGGHSGPVNFKVIPETGQILFDRPYIESFNQPADLAAGGAAVRQADDLRVILAYSRGALNAVYPPDVSGSPAYAGTSYTQAGLQRTLYADVDTWVYEGNQATMTALAQMLHKTRCNTVISGTVRYKGAYTDVWDVGVGHRLSFASSCGVTGDESLSAPVRSVSVRFGTSGGGLLATTVMTVSSRCDPRTSEGMYMHLSQYGSGYSVGGSISGLPGVYVPDAGINGDPGEGFDGGGGFIGGGVRAGKYIRNEKASKFIGKKSSTPESRKAAEQKHKADLAATRAAGKTKADQHQQDLEKARSSGDTADMFKSATGTDAVTPKEASPEHVEQLRKTREAGKAKAEQHKKDLKEARERSKQFGDTKDLLAEAKGDES